MVEDWCQNCYPNYGVNKIYEPSEVEAHEGFEVSNANTCSHPNAVMIEASDADIALWTMHSSWRLSVQKSGVEKKQRRM